MRIKTLDNPKKNGIIIEVFKIHKKLSVLTFLFVTFNCGFGKYDLEDI